METTPLTLNTEDLKSKATEVGNSVKAYAVSIANGNASIRVVALAGGIALVFDSIHPSSTIYLRLILSKPSSTFTLSLLEHPPL
jgi:hypothetical protein